MRVDLYAQNIALSSELDETTSNPIQWLNLFAHYKLGSWKYVVLVSSVELDITRWFSTRKFPMISPWEQKVHFYATNPLGRTTMGGQPTVSQCMLPLLNFMWSSWRFVQMFQVVKTTSKGKGAQGKGRKKGIKKKFWMLWHRKHYYYCVVVQHLTPSR